MASSPILSGGTGKSQEVTLEAVGIELGYMYSEAPMKVYKSIEPPKIRVNMKNLRYFAVLQVNQLRIQLFELAREDNFICVFYMGSHTKI